MKGEYLGQVLAQKALKMQGEVIFCCLTPAVPFEAGQGMFLVNHQDGTRAPCFRCQSLLLTHVLLLKEKALIKAGCKLCIHQENVICH